MHVVKWLKHSNADQRGITGLETAIILIAFVVVSSVFAYTVLSAGLFSSEKGKEAIHAGLQQAQGALVLVGGVIAKDNTPGDDNVDDIVFSVASALEAAPIDLTITVDSDNDGIISDETGKTHLLVITYTDKNQVVGDIAWTRKQIGKGTDHLLETDEKFQITVDVSKLATRIVKDYTFTLEVKPAQGSALVFERTTPSNIDAVMYLN